MNNMSQTAVPVGDEAVGARRVDTSRGQLNTTVSSQWFRRPDDQRFLSLDDLVAFTTARRDNAFEEQIDANELRFDASQADDRSLRVITPGGESVSPSHYAFGQLCQTAKAPVEYLRSIHAWRAALNLQADLLSNGNRVQTKVYGDTEQQTLRAVTGPRYGRIYDADVATMVQRFAGNGVGDTRWKIPGVMDWGTSMYNPYVDPSKETTTLFASDRDMFLFLCDDTHPVEIGKLPNGDPDLIFRGFYVWNSEVGARSLGIATFWLRAICQNRNLWGVEDFDQLRIIHSRHGNERFVREAAPALERYASSDPIKLLAGITAAREATVATTDEERTAFLTDRLNLTLKQSLAVVGTCEREEGKKPESVWDFVQGLTAVARTMPHQDERIGLEKVAANLMDRAARHVA